ncbi:MAG: hypothetical protein ABEJ95_02430 [Candidatus Nanohalobium sp.]
MVLLLLPLYIGAVNSLPSDVTYGNCGTRPQEGATENVGFCTKVSATVQRSYYMGLVDMKTRVLGLNIDPVSKLMPWIVLFLSATSYRFLNKDNN